MIATLHGIVEDLGTGSTIINVGGVGYGVVVSASTVANLTMSETCKLYIYEHIKEDAHLLFGFRSPSDKQLFEQLLGVKNVGPKVAMAVLDIDTSDAVCVAIASGDVKRLQSAKGVGKRAAEQIVVELRDKMGLLVGSGADDVVYRGAADMQDEAVQALIALGYTEADAARALKSVDKELPLEDRITQALRGRS